MENETVQTIAMACFVEGIEPASLALSATHLAQAEACLAELRGDSDTDTYYRCLEALSREIELA